MREPRLQIDLPTFPHAVLAGQGQAASGSTPAEHPVDALPSGVWIALQASRCLSASLSLQLEQCCTLLRQPMQQSKSSLHIHQLL